MKAVLLSLIGLMSAASAHAEMEVFTLELRDHVFIPEHIEIPAGKKVKLVIKNHDNTAEEFDSFDLNREKVIFANRSVTIYVGPLKPGEYEFFGEFHPQTARGYVVVKEQKNANK